MKNICAQFHPAPIWNDRAWGIFWRLKNRSKISSNTKSVPDLENESETFCWLFILECCEHVPKFSPEMCQWYIDYVTSTASLGRRLTDSCRRNRYILKENYVVRVVTGSIAWFFNAAVQWQLQQTFRILHAHTITTTPITAQTYIYFWYRTFTLCQRFQVLVGR